MSVYWHVRKEDVRRNSATVVDPPFASFDVVLRSDYDRLREAARNAFDTGAHEAWMEFRRLAFPEEATGQRSR